MRSPAAEPTWTSMVFAATEETRAERAKAAGEKNMAGRGELKKRKVKEGRLAQPEGKRYKKRGRGGGGGLGETGMGRKLWLLWVGRMGEPRKR